MYTDIIHAAPIVAQPNTELVEVDADILAMVQKALDKYPTLYRDWDVNKVVHEALLDWLGVPKHDAGQVEEWDRHNQEEAY